MVVKNPDADKTVVGIFTGERNGERIIDGNSTELQVIIAVRVDHAPEARSQPERILFLFIGHPQTVNVFRLCRDHIHRKYKETKDPEPLHKISINKKGVLVELLFNSF